ncbi:DUF3037 domain-containing protein [uncultured Zhongshania sp.]|uniref:DUF3037 domain-containing protein n=1 Tax=uncultured Zhongshania sp. TaxID=1642288 RepID=UPI0025D51B20|nr:DUF3037 domain-containing protein [uncultured Zhongshania sp.]
MTKLAAKYSIVRFAPYLETGEFANVGVVVYVPALGMLDFKLNTKSYGRVTSFFSELDRKVYTQALKILKTDLERIKGVVGIPAGYDIKQEREDYLGGHFKELVRTRETIIQFSEPRVIACNNVRDALETTYNRYVERDFVTKEYVETTIEKGLKNLLNRANLAERFHKENVGNELYRVSFPFVERSYKGAAKLIKPLHLAQDTPTKIIEHSDTWSSKVSRLVERQFAAPEKVLFVVAAPEANAGALRLEAYEESIAQLGRLGTIVQRGDDKGVISFASMS